MHLLKTFILQAFVLLLQTTLVLSRPGNRACVLTDFLGLLLFYKPSILPFFKFKSFVLLEFTSNFLGKDVGNVKFVNPCMSENSALQPLFWG